MISLFNVLADGKTILVDADHRSDVIDGEKRKTLRGAVLAKQDEEECHEAFNEAWKNTYFVHGVVIFGKRKEDKDFLVELLKSNVYKRKSFQLYVIDASAEEILNCYSFLAPECALEFEMHHSAIPHQIFEYLYLGDYSAAQNKNLEEMVTVSFIITCNPYHTCFAKGNHSHCQRKWF